MQSYKRKIFLEILILAFIGCVAVFIAHWKEVKNAKTLEEKPRIEEIRAMPPEPKYFYFIKDSKQKLSVKAEAYFVGDLDTGEAILSNNADKIFPIASVSKLMTATVSQESLNQDDITQISSRAIATLGENGGLRAKEKIRVGDLTYPLLLESSNDAAEAIAESSGRDSFIKKMNDKAKELGLLNTSFEDPSGLSKNNKSTVLDLFKLSEYLASKKPDLLKITTEKSFKNKTHIWYNGSQFVGFQGYIGGKRGYIDASKQTAISIFSLPIGEEGTRRISISVLRSPDRYKDISNILNYLKKNVYYGLEADAHMAWLKQKEGIPEYKDPDFVTLSFLGDMMLDRGVKNSVMKNFGGDYSSLFANMGDLKKYDIAFASLYGSASDQGEDLKNLYSFRMDPNIIPALKGAGLSVVSIANSHMGDYGRIAFNDTLQRLKENEILYAGGGMNTGEAENPVIIEKYGMKIGYLAVSDKGPAWLEAGDNKAGVLLATNPKLDEIIQNASIQVNFLVVSFNFGEEYKGAHDARQEELAHRAIDAGAKIVVGSYPHVIQDTEIYKNGYIAYSLGNFIFDQSFSKETMQGMLLELKLWRDGSMTSIKNTVILSPAFQPEKIIKGKEEKVKFVK